MSEYFYLGRFVFYEQSYILSKSMSLEALPETLHILSNMRGKDTIRFGRSITKRCTPFLRTGVVVL